MTTFHTPSSPRRVDKPWGYELIWAETERYAGKTLHVEGGEALSLQFHERKDETIYLLSGVLRLEVGLDTQPLQTLILAPGHSFRIQPGLRHRMTALETCDVLEVSTPELDDVVRLEDRYGRVGK
ncbi:MAG: cupin domain-containing protein [Deltaproteobacteria bacterium]|nr:cupin domain-containing protein [Deltaproteobacteria bacterium]